MTSDSLIHDAAWATAMQIVQVFAASLREEEQRDAFAEVYQRVKAGLEQFQAQESRMLRRLRPGVN